MLKNLLAVLTILLVFATTTSAQNKYFLTYYKKAQKLYDAEDYINATLYCNSKATALFTILVSAKR